MNKCKECKYNIEDENTVFTYHSIDHETCTKPICMRCNGDGCKSFEPRKKPTIYDHLVEGGVEAWAKKIGSKDGKCEICEYIYNCRSHFGDDKCKQGILEHLNQEWKG